MEIRSRCSYCNKETERKITHEGEEDYLECKTCGNRDNAKDTKPAEPTFFRSMAEYVAWMRSIGK